MLAMKSYEQNEGFSVMTADEMYFVNGGSCSTGAAVAVIAGCAVVGVVGGALTGGAAAVAAGATANFVIGSAMAGGAITEGLAGAGIGAAIVSIFNH